VGSIGETNPCQESRCLTGKHDLVWETRCQPMVEPLLSVRWQKVAEVSLAAPTSRLLTSGLVQFGAPPLVGSSGERLADLTVGVPHPTNDVLVGERC
jgi:hypothetical protein